MMMENPDKNVVYTDYDGDIDQLTERFRDFCGSEYGDECEFGQVSVEREKDGGSWKLHEFNGLSEDAVQAFRNHLKAPTDIIRIRFGGKDDKLEFVVAKAKNTVSISRYVRKKHLESMDSDQIVVLAVENSEDVDSRHKRFIESLS